MFSAFDFEKTEYSGIFSDVSKEDDFADMLETFVDKGVISRDVRFRPYNNISREEFSKVLVTTLKSFGGLPLKYEMKNFTDSDKIGLWAVSYVENACRAGLIEGNADGSFNPKGNITKAQCAAMILRAVDVLGNMQVIE